MSSRLAAPATPGPALPTTGVQSQMAALPPRAYMPASRRVRLRRTLVTFGDLFTIQFASVRTAWQWFFLVSSVIPLGLLFFLHSVAMTRNTATILYYITGNVIISLMLNSLAMLAGQLSWAKQSNTFDFYAGLPVSRAALILAIVAIAVLFAIPGMILLLILGGLIFVLPLSINPLVVLVLLLTPLALSGLGALIGVLAPSQQVANVVTNLSLVVVMFLSPVLAPAAALPGVLRVTSWLLPPTYAAEALRITLAGTVNAVVWRDLAILILFSVASLYLVTSKLDWRSR
ncbi:MAG TPA: ABC transporter permease [Chloroflexota bacterium]|nr:ABC transporter permease [Chloroflexota bacterium]